MNTGHLPYRVNDNGCYHFTLDLSGMSSDPCTLLISEIVHRPTDRRRVRRMAIHSTTELGAHDYAQRMQATGTMPYAEALAEHQARGAAGWGFGFYDDRNWRAVETYDTETVVIVRDGMQWEPSAHYRDVFGDIAHIMTRQPYRACSLLTIDATAQRAAMSEVLRGQFHPEAFGKVRPLELTWTGGEGDNPAKRTVSKVMLMNTLKVRMENNRFVIPDDLDADVREALTRELAGLYRRTSTATSTTFDTDEPHDDWVACAAMACYRDTDRAKRFEPRFDAELYQPGLNIVERFGSNVEPAKLVMRRDLRNGA